MPAETLDPLEVLALICDHEHWKLCLGASEMTGFGGTAKTKPMLVLTTLDVLDQSNDLIACAAVGDAHNLRTAASECNVTLLALIDGRAK